MLPDYLDAFNGVLQRFQITFPAETWSKEFTDSLLNDYSFFSARVEDSKLQYGDTIRFLNNEIVRGVNLKSLLGISEHQRVLKNIVEQIAHFELTEKTIKEVHAALMEAPLAWESDFRPELVGQYRNIPIIGARRPFFEDKEYAPHFNLEIIMASYIDIFNARFNEIDNAVYEKHLITALAFFHNKFLNEIHPFADGNGRVCRILMGAIMMKHNCPPVFPTIKEMADQIRYINTIVDCEKQKDDRPLVAYFAKEMTKYLVERLENAD